MRQYNPLSVDELGKNAVRALMDYPSDRLPPQEMFDGAGVYTIHYAGNFEAYANLGDIPIYVGKAETPGKRHGHSRSKPPGRVLYNRLRQHSRSIDDAGNLYLDDFGCRWLVLDPVWIGLTEQLLIAEYRPLWNVLVDGFGHHDQGKTRRSQERSRWDTLHPGRQWASHQRDNASTVTEIVDAIAEHQKRRKP